MRSIDATDKAFQAPAEQGVFRGIVENLSSPDYHSLKKYWCSSDLKYMYSKSAEHFYARYFGKTHESNEPTKAMILGSLAHTLILTPDLFEYEFFILPDLNLRTNDGKAAKEEFLANNPNKLPIKSEWLHQANEMKSAVMSHPKASKIIKETKKEIAYFWQCKFSELPFRLKADGVGPNYFLELKTTASAKPDDFSRQIDNLNYDLSLNHYRQGITALGDDISNARFIVVEQEFPYSVAVYKAGQSLWDNGHAKWLDAVQKLESGIKKKDWPGYTPYEEEMEIQAPRWAIKTYAEQGE